jgi:hypothetical protein
MKKWVNSDSISGLIIVIISIFFLSMTNKMPISAARFPKLVLSILGILGFVLFIRGIKSSLKNKNLKETITFTSFKNPIIAISLITIYVVLLKILGFYIATALYTVLFMLFFQERKIKTILLTAIAINLFVYLLFVVQLNVQLPQGFLYLFEGMVR